MQAETRAWGGESKFYLREVRPTLVGLTSRFLQLIGDGISRRPQGFVICHAIKKEDKEQP